MSSKAAFRNAMEVVRHLGDDAPPWDEFLRASRTFLGADATAFLMFDGMHNLDEVRHSDTDSSSLREYREHYYRHDAIAQASVNSPAGVWWDSVVLSNSPESRKLPFYADFMPRHRLGQVTALILLAEPGRRIAVSFHRMTARQNAIDEFTSGGTRLFTDALLNAVKMRAAKSDFQLSAVEETLASFEEVAFLLNRKQELVRCSPEASKLLEEAKMLSGASRCVSHPKPDIATGLSRSIEEALTTSRTLQYCVPLSWGVGIRFDIAVAPQNLRMADESLLFVRGRKTSAFNVPQAMELAAFFDLSVAESRVLLKLVEGRSPKEIAIANGVAERTIRNQVASLMNKMSCSRLSELVRLGSLLR